ncbi:MAG: sulfatase-like hydrolase/transferase [Planctomycetales bacterium]
MTMIRFRLLPPIAVLLAVLNATPVLPAAGPPPNLVLIFIDDLGYGDVGAFHPECGNRTPHLDRMAREGMKLTSFYAAPVCTPSRAQVLTGCYAKRVSLPNVLSPGAAAGLHPDEQTIAELLQAQGYATTCIGKWHLGDQPQCLPTRHGFDHYFGIPYSNDMHFLGGPAQGKVPLVRDEQVAELLTGPEQSTLTARYTDAAVQFIRGHRDRPFFLYLPHTAVHVPIYPGERFAGKSANGKYGDWVEEVDWGVGRILDALRDLKLDEKTLVVFTSDNGPWLTQGRNGGVAGPLRGGKGGTYEGGVRVPTIAWWPGRIAAGGASDALGVNIDFLPTFVALAGGNVPADRKIDGRDLSDVLLGRATESPHEAWFYFFGTQLQAVRSGRWKLAIARQDERNERTGKPQSNPVPFTPTLYDLDEDIGEQNNVIGRHPDVVRRLQGLIAGMDADLGTTKAGPGVRPPAQIANPRPLVANPDNPAPVEKPLPELKLGETLASEAAPRIASKPFTVSCQVAPESQEGVIVAHGGTGVGYALHLRDGKPCFTVRSANGAATIAAEKAPTGKFNVAGQLQRNGAMTLAVNGEVVARGQAGGLVPHHPQEDLSVGFDAQQPITDYGPGKFAGTIEGLRVEIEE